MPQPAQAVQDPTGGPPPFKPRGVLFVMIVEVVGYFILRNQLSTHPNWDTIFRFYLYIAFALVLLVVVVNVMMKKNYDSKHRSRLDPSDRSA
jgi:uncharacterized membrane protein